MYNEGTVEMPKWILSVQIHPIEGKSYISREYEMDSFGTTIGRQRTSDTVVPTGFETCAVTHISSITTSGTVYGYDDYVPIDSI